MSSIEIVNTLLVRQEEEIEAVKNGSLEPKAGRVVQGMRRNQLTYVGHAINYRRLQMSGSKGPKMFDGLLGEADKATSEVTDKT